jgi:RHS repeat-associated protein
VEEAYSYDPVGNRLTGPERQASQYDAANRLTQDSKNAYNYDANGNLIEKRSLKDGRVTTFSYDAEDRLIRVLTPKAEVTFQYDPLGRRIEKRVIRWHDEDGDHEPDEDEERPPRVTRYLYDQEDILATFTDSGRELARYTHGPGIDEPLAEVRKHRTRFYHADTLGSIIALSNKHGHPVRSYRYSAFGVPEDHRGDPQPYRFTGREWDKETGLYYYRARYYSPSKGRFLREDPLGFSVGVNFYTYVRNNSLRFIDPFGLDYLTFDGSRVTWYTDSGQALGKWSAASGPWGQGALPPGEYSGNTLRTRTNPAMTREGIGWSLNLDPNFETERTLLRIHPDGNVPGTEGCIGIQAPKAALSALQNRLQQFLNKAGNIPVYVFYPVNP